MPLTLKIAIPLPSFSFSTDLPKTKQQTDSQSAAILVEFSADNCPSTIGESIIASLACTALAAARVAYNRIDPNDSIPCVPTDDLEDDDEDEDDEDDEEDEDEDDEDERGDEDEDDEDERGGDNEDAKKDAGERTT